LDKTGPGTQTLSGSNAYTGITSVSEGVLSLANSLAMQNSALDASASVTGDASNGLKTTVTTLTLGGLLGDKNLASVFTTASGGYSGLTELTLNTGATANHEYSGIIANGAAGMTLVKSGAGTQMLAGANTYTGNTTISAGTLKLGASGVIPDGSGKGNVAVEGTLDLSGNDDVINGLSGAGVVDNSAADTVSTFTLGGNNQTGSFSGILQNSGSLAILNLIKTGTGTQTLTAASTYAGLTTINAGGLNIQSPGALGTGAAGTQVIGSGTASSSNARLELQGGITVAGEALNIQGAGNYLGALTSVSGNNEWAGNVTIGAAGTRIGASAGATLKISGVIDSGTDVFGPMIRNSDLTGVVILSAANTYLGDTTLFIGKMQLDGGDNRLPVAGKLILGSGTFTSEFDLNARNQEVAGLSITSGATAANNAINNSSTTLSTLTVNTASASPSSFDGILKGNLALAKTGADALTLTGANTYSGDTTVMQGTLSLGSSNNANDASTVNVAQAGATLNLAFAGTDTVGKLFIGGIQKPAGIYGAVGSASPVIGIPQITGTGTLTVTSSPLPGYGTWSSANAGGQSAEFDFDFDGVANGIEYILGGSNSANDHAKLPTSSTSGGNMVFTFVRDQASIDGITTIEIQVSPDLTDWTTGYPVPDGEVANNPGLTVQKNIPASGYDTVRLTLPLTDLTKFARLKVTP
jgi:autotransporter-associated beta strand protein